METLNKIMEIMKEKNLKQKDLTDFLNLGKGTFTEWKSGKTNSYLRYIPKIAINDDDVKVALFGGDGEVTDEMWNEVKTFVAFIKEKNKKNNDND